MELGVSAPNSSKFNSCATLLKHELPKLHAVTCPSNREGFRTASGAPGCPNLLPVRDCMVPALRADNTWRLFLDSHSSPERDVVFDLFSRRFGIGVVPRRTGILLAIDLDVVVTGQTLPWTSSVMIVGLEELLPNCIWREILITFYFDGSIALCKDGVFPDCFCHNTDLDC
jgi:hypothetical protein